jgi:hypothetical protein
MPMDLSLLAVAGAKSQEPTNTGKGVITPFILSALLKPSVLGIESKQSKDIA